MDTNQSLLDNMLSLLPEYWHEPVNMLADELLQTNTPLNFTLVGSFSVGKSSMINMLIGEELLWTALEEATALPTFIEHGNEKSMQIIGTDGSCLPIDDEGFIQATTKAPNGAACAVLSLPQSWLSGVSIVDLPGLGSLSSSHREYTMAQIRQADAVLYLIDPRGPSAIDVETLKFIAEMGKCIKVMVTRWDMVQLASQRGEKIPSLVQWGTQIQTHTGLITQLAPCSRNGLGREEIFNFIEQAKQNLQSIRLHRFRAELKPILENALGTNTNAQRACSIESEETARQFHQELMDRKQQLMGFKAEVYAQEGAARDEIEAKGIAAVQTGYQSLDYQLKALRPPLSEQEWVDFGKAGSEILKASIIAIADEFSHISEDIGSIELPLAQVDAFDLRLPKLEAICAENFIDIGRFTQFQQELENKQADLAHIEERLGAIPYVDLTEHELALKTLMRERDAITSLPLPQIVQHVNSGNGAVIGRMAGEVADIALLFVNPALAGSKVAALLGKGSKAATVAKQTIKTTLEIINATKTGSPAKGIPEEVINKLSVLEMLSLGYWGERIGSRIGGGQNEIFVDDPEAKAMLEHQLAELDSKTEIARISLQKNEALANERQLTGWALEQNKNEQIRLKNNLEYLQKQAQGRLLQAEQDQATSRKHQLESYTERALRQWLVIFERQTSVMRELLREQVKRFWAERVNTLIEARLSEIDTLDLQARAGVKDKADQLKTLILDAEAIQRALVILN